MLGSGVKYVSMIQQDGNEFKSVNLRVYTVNKQFVMMMSAMSLTEVSNVISY